MSMVYFLPFAAAVLTVSFTICNRDLNDASAKLSYVERLQTPWFERNYRAALEYYLDKLDKIFRDTRPFSRSGYLFCSVVSFVYSLFGFLVAWSFGGPAKIGTTLLLPETWPIESRLTFTALLLLVCVLLGAFTASPVVVLYQVRKFLRRFVSVSARTGTLAAILIFCAEFVFLYAYTRDFTLLTLLVISSGVLGVWLSLMCLAGGATIGWIAAIFGAFDNDGTYRMIASIAILASIALGGSRGTRRVATLLSVRYREISARYGALFPSARIVRKFGRAFPAIVFALVGATGAAAFIAAASRTFAYIIGPEIDVLLLESLGFASRSPALPLVGAIAGSIGGALAYFLGATSVIASSFLAALLLGGVLSTGALSRYTLSDYFRASSFVSAAMINVLLFFVILPPINAFWDWLAWGLSRWLCRKNLPAANVKTLAFQAVLGVFSGFVLLVGLTISATGAITVFNKWMFLHTETIPLPLDELARTTIQNPLSAEGFWITVMLFSTFLPSLCFLVFVLFSVQLVVRTPKSWRSSIAQRIVEAKTSADSILPVAYFSAIPIVGGAVVLGLAWLVFEILSILEIPISKFLYAIVRWIIS
jgi:hypothetical protein